MRWIILLCCVMLSFFGSTAVAQDADNAEAKQCYERGQRLYDLGNYTGAIEEFKRGYLLSGLPAFLLNMGQAYKQLGDNTNALDYYKRYLAKIESDDPIKPSVEKIIAELEAAQAAKREGPAFDSGLTQDEIKASLGPEYKDYVASGLTYEGYNQVKKGKRTVKIGIGVFVGTVAGGIALAAIGKSSDNAGAFTGAATTLIVLGIYGGYYTVALGNKKVTDGKTKLRANPNTQ